MYEKFMFFLFLLVNLVVLRFIGWDRIRRNTTTSRAYRNTAFGLGIVSWFPAWYGPLGNGFLMVVFGLTYMLVGLAHTLMVEPDPNNATYGDSFENVTFTLGLYTSITGMFQIAAWVAPQFLE